MHPNSIKHDYLPAFSRPLKIWRWSEEYKYAIPKPDGDYWDIILERHLAKDKFQCDAWKDEVQNLLIFVSHPKFLLLWAHCLPLNRI